VKYGANRIERRPAPEVVVPEVVATQPSIGGRMAAWFREVF
jgi:hypothetical protein